ncbi:MAG: Arginine/ornithine antiporter ArcD [uncultured Sulfurovum sp.]|uniref:Arginine/ornithine antiporter ArcD n=1 Tax=uncultured Sulfurovum sp. TaxID=269237 RepID=A0A6S6TH58_9BACT|nr:MAG: Arginine/ornithine antiporter ArcD [uncultured Sulfurovum sp.]
MSQNHSSSTPCFINYIVLSLFGTLFFIAILLGYLNIIPLKVDLHSVIIIGGIYFVYLFFIRHNANFVVCKMRTEYVNLQKELQQNIKDNSLTILNETKSTININDFISEYYTTFRNDNYASIASSLFPMLGILGTFTAIAISMPDFSSANEAALDHEISLLLSGIGTAFYASIYGIFLSIVWSFFEKRGLSKVDADSHQLHEVYSSYIWSESELKRHEHMQHDMRDQKMIQALKETFNLEFIQTLNERHLENFQTIITETNKNFSTITSHMQMVSTDLKDTIAKIEASKSALTAHEKIDKSIHEFTQVTSSLDQTINQLDITLEKSLNLTFEKIDNEVGEIVMKLANFAHSTSEQNKILQRTITEYHHNISQQIVK